VTGAPKRLPENGAGNRPVFFWRIAGRPFAWDPAPGEEETAMKPPSDYFFLLSSFHPSGKEFA
jgi:hypothetical protein